MTPTPSPRPPAATWRTLLFTLSCVAAAACHTTSTPSSPAFRPLFDGSSLKGLAPIRFGGEGEVEVEHGALLLDYGNPLTGVTFTTADGQPWAPDTDCYEVELVAARVEGTDFFCGLTFPVRDAHLTLVLGGWGGSVCGLSNLDGADAASNDTRTVRGFENGVDYTVLVRVTPERVEVQLDDEQLLAADVRDRDLSLRPEVDLCLPFGLCSFGTRARIQSLRWRPIVSRAAASAAGCARAASPAALRSAAPCLPSSGARDHARSETGTGR